VSERSEKPSPLEEWWAENRAELRLERLQREQEDPGLPAYPWDAHGRVQDPPMPVSYVAAARERLHKVFDLPRLRARVLKLLGMT
jgi:hypothetical protein